MRMKVLASAVLTGVLVLASVGSAFADGPKGGSGEFRDLGNAQFAQSAIMTLAAQGVVNGVTSTQFDPGAPITLGQLSAILLRYQGKVTAQSSFSSQLQTAQEDGYFSGIGSQASSGENATRAQAMSMIASALGLSGAGTAAEGSVLGQFQDRGRVPAWAQGSMSLGVQLGLLKGDRGNLMPQGDITRAELAVLLMRIEQLLGASSTVQNSTVRGTFVSAGSVTGTTGQTQQTVTLSVYGTQSTSGSTGSTATGTSETFTVSPVAQVFYGNQTSTLASFKVGDPIFLTLDQDGQAAVIVDTASTEVQTQAGTVTGTVYQVNSGSISITAPSSGGEQEQQGSLGPGTYPLSSSVGVVLGGMAGNVSNVAAGDLVRLVIDSSGQVTLIIVKSQVEGVSGTVWRTHEDWLMLATSQGFVRVMANGQTQITRNGQTATLQDIMPGDQVQAQGVSGEGGLVAQTITVTGTTSPSPLNPIPQSQSHN